MKIFKLSAAAVAIAAAWVTQPVFGGTAPAPTHQIDITENSPISLSATYDGSPVTVLNTNPDQWTVTFPTTVSFVGGPVEWAEPENSNLANVVTFSPATFTLTVFSDLGDHVNGFIPLPNGSTVNNVGTDSINGVSVSATFNDNAATAEVPDTGTTFSLFGLSLAGLAFLHRKIPA
jgi:hypothetical protein